MKQIFYSSSINSKFEFQRNNKQNTQSKIIILLLFLLLQKKRVIIQIQKFIFKRILSTQRTKYEQIRILKKKKEEEI